MSTTPMVAGGETDTCEWCNRECSRLWYETLNPPDLDGNDVIWVCDECRDELADRCEEAS